MKLQLRIMASVKSCSHRTFIKESSMKMKFHNIFEKFMRRKENLCYKKRPIKLEKLSFKQTQNNGEVAVIELHRKKF